MTDTATTDVSDDLIHVRYVRNSIENNTGSISFHDDSRDPLLMGSTGYMTQEEMHNAISYGVVLEVVEEEPEVEGVASDESLDEHSGVDDVVDLNTMTVKELREVAKGEGTDVTGLRQPGDIINAINAARMESATDGDADPQPDATTETETAS